tara:strand:- start:3841 stop:4092 length:252 start_codon:yes stop_codon:yes gene_type:complete
LILASIISTFFFDKSIITDMDINEINNEIDCLIDELNTVVKSLANSRELIAENSNKRASNYLSETEIALQSIAGRVSKIKLLI